MTSTSGPWGTWKGNVYYGGSELPPHIPGTDGHVQWLIETYKLPQLPVVREGKWTMNSLSWEIPPAHAYLWTQVTRWVYWSLKERERNSIPEDM